MPKRKCTFNDKLKTKYPFVKQRSDPSDVTCEKCRTDFSVAHGGAGDIEKHLRSEKHKLSDHAAASSSSMLNFFKKTDSPSSKDFEVTAAEATWAYHTVQESHSFRSNDCASRLIQTCFEQKFKCARTKSEAIVVNVLAPMAIHELNDHLHKANCITLLTDASNHGSTKLFPVLVRYFLPYEGVQVKILDFQEQPGETSDIIVDYLKQVLTKNELTSKIVAFCGDNTNCNFGGKNRKGVNNVYAKLNTSLGRTLIGIGCGAHIIHNAVKTAADCLPVDFECIIVKIYSFFYIYSVRVEALKEFCNAANTEYKQLLGYTTFHQAVLKIEGQNVSAIDAANEINQLQNNLDQKQNSCYLPHATRNIMVKLQETGDINKENVKTAASNFYKTSKEYLEQWCQFNEEVKKFEWANLRKVPSWEDVQKVMDLLIEQKFISSSQDTGVFDEFSLISKYITAQKIYDWNTGNIPTENRWVEVVTHFNANDLSHVNFSIIIEYILCLPGSNAPVERVFSLMNKIWSSEKSQLGVGVLKAILITKGNINKSCQEFHSYIKTKQATLKQICGSDKYKSAE
ncbi:hypothetical protein QTP88_010420 [Uroleucon formosanum]